MQDFFSGKTVLVTGASGSVGQALIAKLLTYDIAELRCVDLNEERMFLIDIHYKNDPRIQTFVCNITDRLMMPRVMEKVDYVIHAAALKHVPSCERSPETAIDTNILGVENVIASARQMNVKKVLFTSSDKAVNPTNVMGTSKLMGERLITAANLINYGDHTTAFMSTRFGNVAGSSGSVIPVFAQQTRNGGPITLTDPQMSRFMMSLEESVMLILKSLVTGMGGEIFITKMPVFRIETLAHEIVDYITGDEKRAVEIEVIGIRPGEKLFEELMTEEEQGRSFEMDDLFVVLPAHKSMYQSSLYEKYQSLSRPDRPYISKDEPEASRAVLRKLIEVSLNQYGTFQSFLRDEAYGGPQHSDIQDTGPVGHL